MKKPLKTLLCLGTFGFFLGIPSQRIFAQDDVPFDEIDAELSGDAPKKEASVDQKKKKKPKKTVTVKETPPPKDDLELDAPVEPQEVAKDAAPAKAGAPKKDALKDDLAGLDDDPLADNTAKKGSADKKAAAPDDLPLDDMPPDEVATDDANAAKAETPTEDLTENPDEGVRDILEPDKGLSEPEGEKVVEEPKPEVPKALQSTEEVVSTLDPSESLARIPLRPPMSDQNWKKYAGPALDKLYRIRRKDTLWAISERLFGNPYLWPKVWQLNAQFGNPHEIDPGIEMQFFVGNPNSAPILAFKLKEGGTEFLPVIDSIQQLSFLEELESMIHAQSKKADPPFKSFLVENVPEEVAKVPHNALDGRVLYAERDQFIVEDLPDGEYSVVRPSSLKAVGAVKVDFSGYRLKWLGVIKVTNKIAEVTKSFGEIVGDDLIVAKDFGISALSLHEETLGEMSKQVHFAPLEDGAMAVGLSSYRSIGIRFPSKDEGPQPGAILKYRNELGELGTLLLVHRDGRLATGWLTGSAREITTKDKLE